MGEAIRYAHEQLLVCIALQLGFRIQSLNPCFLDDRFACVRGGFVESGDGVEVDMLVKGMLQCRRYIVRMIVLIAMRMGVVVLVVTVMRHVVMFCDWMGIIWHAELELYRYRVWGVGGVPPRPTPLCLRKITLEIKALVSLEQCYSNDYQKSVACQAGYG